MSSRDTPAEPAAWADGLVVMLIRRAAAKAPPSLSERLEEEWLADLGAREGLISRLRFALGCSWATKVIAHELGVPLRAAAAASADKPAVAVVPHGPLFRSRGTTIFMLIVGLHALVICGLATGMGPKILKVIPERIAVTAFTTNPVTRVAPPTSNPTLTSIAVVAPPPKWQLTEPPSDAGPVPEGPGAISPPAGPATPRQIQRIVGGPGHGFPVTNDYYPSASIRLEEKGSAGVQVCVDAGGRLTVDPRLTQSSGSPRLDQGALKLARAGSGHYRPTIEDGRPVSSCFDYRITFKLNE